MDDIGNESDFTPNKKKKGKAREEDNNSDSGDDMSEDISKLDETRRPVPSKKEQRRSKPTVKGPSRRGRSSHSLPAPLVQHRHRAVSLFSRSERVERLDEPPSIFQSNSITMTTACTNETKVADRVSRSWGYNVGPGPLWELIEDRGWFKEAAPTGETEAHRRPRVYEHVRVREGWEVLSEA